MKISTSLSLISSCLFFAVSSNFTPQCLAFVATNHNEQPATSRIEWQQVTPGLPAASTSSSLFMSTAEAALTATENSASSAFKPSATSLEKLTIVKAALKRPRGSSIGLEYLPSIRGDGGLSHGDLTILSMQLRKSKAAVIWTCDVPSISTIVKEQSSAQGDFPGPCPVIYWGDVNSCEDVAAVVEGGATAVVLEYGNDVEPDMLPLLENVGVIWKVSSKEQINELTENEMGDVFLLADKMVPLSSEDGNAEMIKNFPKSIVTISTLPSMQPENSEVAQGKLLSSIGISSLLVQSCCVGDEEDVKYSQFVINQISKKSSSSFSMTGLTGSTNGHFGTSSHEGEMKWRRCS